jgi:DNA-binding IscR family transcriptional regulator
VQLRDHGIAKNRRGSQGDHRPMQDPAGFSIADIIRIVGARSRCRRATASRGIVSAWTV